MSPVNQPNELARSCPVSGPSFVTIREDNAGFVAIDKDVQGISPESWIESIIPKNVLRIARNLLLASWPSAAGAI